MVEVGTGQMFGCGCEEFLLYPTSAPVLHSTVQISHRPLHWSGESLTLFVERELLFPSPGGIALSGMLISC